MGGGGGGEIGERWKGLDEELGGGGGGRRETEGIG